MDLRRARIGDWLMGGFGVLLVVSLFLGWYGAPCPSASACPDGGAVSTGWQSFSVIDVFLALAGVVAVAALLLTLLQLTPAVPLALTSVGALLAIAATVLVAVRLLNPPEAAGPGGEAGLLTGAWLGEIAAVGLTASMAASLRDERTTLGRGADEAVPVRTVSLSGSAAEQPGGGQGASEPKGAT